MVSALARFAIALTARIPGTYAWAVTQAQAGRKIRRSG